MSVIVWIPLDEMQTKQALMRAIPGPKVIKLFSMLNSAKHEIFSFS